MYRVEDKYQCSEKELFLLQSKLKTILQSDVNQYNDWGYKITSVYFDTCEDTFYTDAEEGNRQRAKYRLRIYNDSFNVIKLEIKYKLDNRVNKKSCLISVEQMQELLSGDPITTNKYNENALILLFNVAIRSWGLKPRVIVEYERKAFIYSWGNVRITLDRNIRSSTDMKGFMGGNIVQYNALPENDCVLEIKYDEFLPGFIARIIESGNMNQISYSKYRLCRLYEERRYVI